MRKTLGVLVQNTQTKTLKHLQITHVLFENAGVLVCNTFKMRNVFPGIYSEQAYLFQGNNEMAIPLGGSNKRSNFQTNHQFVCLFIRLSTRPIILCL